MNLVRIKHEICPDCGSHAVSEECSSIHSNGQGRERRTFACGASYAWSPNFSRLEQKADCRHSQAFKDREEARRVAKERTIEFVKSLEVDDEYKSSILRWWA